MKKKVIIIVSIVIVVIMFIILTSIIVHSRVKKSNKTKSIEYTCLDSYRLKNNICLKEIESIMPKVDYSCNDGYDLNQDRCIRYEKQEPKAKWTCPSGFSKMEDKEPSVCVRTSTDSPTGEYYCNYGYKLNGSRCTKENIIPATPTYVCSGNAMYNSSIGLCQLVGVTNSCPSGMWSNTSNGPYKTCVGYPTIRYECPSNSRKSGNNCITTGATIDAQIILRCRQGYNLSKDKTTCTKTEYEMPTLELKCNEGYNLDNNTCVKKVFKDANKKYSCTEGYTLDSDRCIKYDKKEPIKKEK